jgi:hypothetical protein
LIVIDFLNIVLIERVLDTSILSYCPLISPFLRLFLLENALELLGMQECVLYSLLLVLLGLKSVVLVEVVVDSHIAAEVNGGQFGLCRDLLRESVEVVAALSGVEEGVGGAGGFFLCQIAQYGPGWQAHCIIV